MFGASAGSSLRRTVYKVVNTVMQRNSVTRILLHDLVDMEKARRILVIVYPTSPLFKQSSIGDILPVVLSKLQAEAQNVRTLYLATWPNRTILVFDLNNKTYDFDTAHKPQDISVTAVHIRTATRIDIKEVSDDLRSKTNSEIAEHHRQHGFTVSLPLIDNHRNGNVPSYPNPRDMES